MRAKTGLRPYDYLIIPIISPNVKKLGNISFPIRENTDEALDQEIKA